MIRDAATAAWVHAAFEYAGIALGVLLYRRSRTAAGQGAITQPGTFAAIAGLLVGAAIGNKAVFFVERPDVWQAFVQGQAVWPGQSIVGGLLGGLLGVEIAKALTRQTRSMGDLMVPPLAAGIVLGRAGCFLSGLNDDTYGVATALPWGIDFGDGVARHPAQLYDMLAVTVLALAVHRRFDDRPGLAFKLFLAGYLGWRWFIDGYKPVLQPYAFGWSGIQWVCALALVVDSPFVWRTWRRT